jgi:AAA family ATP:ADP antiporter
VGSAAEFGRALQLSMAAVIGIAGVAIVLQQYITNQAAAKAAAAHPHHVRRNSSNSGGSVPAPAASAAAGGAVGQQAQQQQAQQQQAQQQKARKQLPSLRATFRVLAASLEIRCLATMSLAQGLCNSLMEFAWKWHLRVLYPSAADFTAFLGAWLLGC